MSEVDSRQTSRSYYHRPRLTPLVYKSIPDKVGEWAQSQPDKEAVVVRFPDQQRQVLTFAEVHSNATRLALQLSHLGVKVGDRVAIYVQNSLEWPIAEFGIMYAGAVAVNVMSYKGTSFLNLATALGCSAFMLDVRHVESKVDLSCLHEAFLSNPTLIKILLQKENKLGNCFDFDDLLQRLPEDDIELPQAIDPDAIGVMWPTSGSTGASKYVPHTHVSLMNGFTDLAQAIGLKNDDIFLHERPMGYAMGFPMMLVAAGTTNVYVDAKLSVTHKLAQYTMDVITEEGITAAYVPCYLLLDMNHLSTEGKSLPVFRTGMVGGQCLDDHSRLAFQRFGKNLHFVYGSTDGLFCSMIPYVDICWEEETIGTYIFPGVEVKLIGDDGLAVPLGKNGEICMRGSSIARNYLYEDSSVKAVRDGVDWLHTGDIGVLQPGGYLTIKGRVKEIIKRATVKIFPGSIEGVLKKHPAVEDAVVVGIPNVRLYEEVCVFVSPLQDQSITEEDLRSYAEDVFQPSLAPDGKGLMPDYFIVMDELPRLPSSKPDRLALKEEGIIKTKAVK